VLALFPDTARIDGSTLELGGIAATELARRYGTPLVVYDEQTLRARARAYRVAAPRAQVVYGAKAFPNVSVMRLLAEEGIGADVSTLGELHYALAAGITGERLVVHGNNKSDDELRAAADAGALVVLDSLEEINRARAAGLARTLVRVTPGVEADTHSAIRTGHVGSKFGSSVDDALEALRRAPEVEGLHFHIGSQLRDLEVTLEAIDAVVALAARARDELGWTLETVDLGGGLGVASTPDEQEITIEEFAKNLLHGLDHALASRGLPASRVILEPGRSLTARAGVTLYTVGAVKRSGGSTFLAVDGGMSDNPRPALYDAPYTALLANRADEKPTGSYTVVGKHCESGDLLIEHACLPEARRGDVLAVPATGAYTLSMSSNYNALPRPAAVLVVRGESRVIRRRETIEDLLALEA
jgi:diaminopimelate decarboxylase